MSTPKDGVVALIGNVASAAEKRRALEIARETDGVKSVSDDLKIVEGVAPARQSRTYAGADETATFQCPADTGR